MPEDTSSSTESTAESAPKGPVGKGDHVVTEGECMDSIALRYGFFWETLWNHGENAELKREREDPFVLLPGDRVHIPEKRRRDESGATDQRHRFRRKGVPSMFQVRVLAAGEPRADEPYRLTIDDVVKEGTTDGDGWVKTPIPPDARKGTLVVGKDGEEDQVSYELTLGGMDPVTETTGVQDRLENLGHECGERGQLDDETRGAISEFQKANELEATGKLDDKTRKKLKEVHGS